MDSLEEILESQARAALEGELHKRSGSQRTLDQARLQQDTGANLGVSNSQVLTAAGEEAAIDMVAARLLPADGRDPNRDRKDAANADIAFTSILSALAALPFTATVVADVLSVGATKAPTATVQAAIVAAAAAVRLAWQKLSVQDRARIWRGGQ